MDGNGRWAKARGLPRVAGHKKGADSVEEVMEACREQGVSYLTLYAFSSENWNRPADEVGGLMDLLRFYLGRELNKLHKNNVCLRVIGDRSKLADDILKEINKAEDLTANNDGLFLSIALSYGSRQEIVQAARIAAEKLANGEIALEDINEINFGKLLYTCDVPDPDLLIRTGGEKRMSNFLLWQSAYTELYFSDILWPDFRKEHFAEAIKEFGLRERRYGTA
jgi:undecaprenyl diphosphate synthase